jgi:rhamnogalacturonan endolyase
MRTGLLFVVGITAAAAVAGERERVSNPGFEVVDEDKRISEWSWWTREKDAGRVALAEERHGGARALRLVHDGARDYALSNARQTRVSPGESYRLSFWTRRAGAAKAGTLDVVGHGGGKLVSWAIGQTAAAAGDGWCEAVSFFTVPEGVDTVYVRITGSGVNDFWVDDIRFEPGRFELPPKGPKVSGWARERPVEPMDRGVVAVQTRAGIYVGWRLLKGEPPDIAFDVYRTAGGARARLTAAPVRQTTDFLDTGAFDPGATYTVEPAAGFGGCAQTVGVVALEARKTPYVSIPLASTNATAQKVGIGDLDGDGVYDYVVKQPGANIDPWHKYWYQSPETFKLEARRSDGTLLWLKDLGWNIERGMWYSPMLVCDLTGDGRAEVAAKIGPEEDCRDADGRVQTGPEFVAVFDGLTGRELARAPWPPRDAFEDYNRASRNQLAVAYLDGRTPCLLALRGTYGLMLADAWQLKGGKLERLWSYSNAGLPALYRGQGAHNCLCADVDGDGRDEVILGSVTLDDDGSVLWCSGKGHPDAHYYGDIDPRRPGMELAYIIETRQRKEGGIHLLDPVTGQILWQLGEPTAHVHSCGMCTDMDVMNPGLEIYGADANEHKLTEHRWLFTSDGRLLKAGKDVDFSFGVPSAWWDADLQREIIRKQAFDYDGQPVSEAIEGSVVLVADVLGDWREEILTTVAGELRIYTTPVPAMDRRVCLMQDEAYRMRTTMNAMGYYQTPILSYVPEALAPNLNLTLRKDGKRTVCRVVAVAPLARALKGAITLTAPKGVTLKKSVWTVDVQAGERQAEAVEYEGKAERGAEIRAELAVEGGPVLTGGVPLGL